MKSDRDITKEQINQSTSKTICKLNSLNSVSAASCCTWPAPAATTNTNGTGAAFAAKYFDRRAGVSAC
ncbi:MAG: hypothetical protein C5B50_03900 [Verrucomicrobia bacterium]|nr:MAG: hypothetical protein C5B50_03900 [Verrucomicrobiota bacterium]